MTKDVMKRIRNKQIVQLYKKDKLTTRQLAFRFSLSQRTVDRVLKEAGVER